MRKPNLFIVGQPKAGTTALHNFLGEHPDIYMTGAKEPHFFCKDSHEESDRYYGFQQFYQFRDENYYLQLFSGRSEQIIGESSTHYLHSQVAAHEIHKFNSDAKIIIMLREPVDWLYSLHNNYVITTTENEKDFVKALELEPLRRKGKFIGRRVRCPSWLYYSDRVKYYDQVKRFYDVFDSSRIKVIIFEDFRKNNNKSYRDILVFLEVDTDFSANYKPVNVKTSIRFERLTYIIYHPALRKISQKIFAFSPEFYELIREKIVERFLWKKDPGIPIKPEIRDRLMRSFKPEVLKISDLLGVDLEKKWGYDKL